MEVNEQREPSWEEACDSVCAPMRACACVGVHVCVRVCVYTCLHLCVFTSERNTQGLVYFVEDMEMVTL